MSKNFSLAIFVALAALLAGLVWFHTGSFMPPSGEDAIWFHAGLLTLLLGAFIVEYRFTRPNDVFVNCLVVFASTSTLTNPPYATWWEVLRWGAVVCAVIAMILAWDPGREAQLQSRPVRAIIYQVVTRIGRAEVIFSLVFILALISYFDLSDPNTKLYVMVWGIFLLVAHLDLPTLGRVAFKSRKFRNRVVLGITHSFLAPSIVYCRKLGSGGVKLHQIVGFCQSVNTGCHCFGLVIGERSSATENRIVVALLNTTIAEAQLNDRTIVITAEPADIQAAIPPITQADLDAVKNIVGTVAKGTNISQVKFELFGSPKIAAGSLLSVKSLVTSVFYQVFGGIIDEEVTLKDSTRAFVEGQAEQVGVWNNEVGGFETHDWVASERSTVRLVGAEEELPHRQLPPTDVTIGSIPNSNYPVNVDLNDLVLYHTGILGVTGSGKSYLTFSLIESCASKGIKTICIDPTGDYQRYLANAVLLQSSPAIEAFLNSPNHMIGIVETAANANVHAILQALQTSRVCLDWCKRNRQDAEILAPIPKVMVVLEEAHLLVPEWNFSPAGALRDRVNETSQIVLQARKFGLGFVVVSQRTANVVKSILNQCNTIVSFQAFDETGFEFLRNYMGSFHVASLPNLKSRHGLLVGKASRSRRPIMVRFRDQVRTLAAAPAPSMPIDLGAAVPIAEEVNTAVTEPPADESGH